MEATKSLPSIGAPREPRFLANRSVREQASLVHPEECPVIIIEKQRLSRESLSAAVIAGLHQPVVTFPNANEWAMASGRISPSAIIFCASSLSDTNVAYEALETISVASGEAPILVLSNEDFLYHDVILRNPSLAAVISINEPWSAVLNELQRLRRPNEIRKNCNNCSGQRTRPSPRLAYLTAREVDIIDLLLKGKTNKIIAYELHITESTVKLHLYNVMRKYAVRNRTELAIHLSQLDDFSPTRCERGYLPESSVA